MYALRIYKSNADKTKHTNTVVDIFETKTDSVWVCKYKRDKEIDWNLSKFRIWPANDKKHTIYSLPPDMKLFLFSRLKDATVLIASVFEADDYISFEPLQKEEEHEMFYLVIAPDEDTARIKLEPI